MLTLSKNIKGLERDINKKIWQKRKVFALLSREINDLNGKTLGIIGKGSIFNNCLVDFCEGWQRNFEEEIAVKIENFGEK